MSETRLPLPIACLRRRSLNSRSKNPKDAHDSALFAWDASLRLSVALRPPTKLQALRRASFGEWARAASVPDVQLEDASLLELFSLASRIGRGEQAQRKFVKPRELLDALAAYRNKAHGHALQEPSFYREAGAVLLAALEAAWQAELFLPRAGMLVFVEAVAIEAQGGRKGHVLELEGESAWKSAPLGISVPVAVLPHRVYWREGERWKPLHPWIAYDDERNQVFFFDKLDRKAHFLDFVSGSPPREEVLATLAPEVEALFARGGERTPRDGDDEVALRHEDPNSFGEFQIVGRLGAGGMGEVFLARQTSLDRLVALKMLPPSIAQDPIARARFAREVEALSRCEHPHVVKILTSGTTRGTPWYAMEYVEGADLVAVGKALSESKDFDTAVSTACAATRSERAELFPDAPVVERKEPVTSIGAARWRDLARFFRDAALGVHHLHARGILHRDLKPGNLMVTAADHRAVVMDLGLAAVESATLSLSHDRSKVLGTLRYMPPEQLQRSLLEVDRRADVYSLGATLYELLTDRPFFDGESEQRLIHQVLKEEPAAPRRLVPAIPADLDLIVRKATEKEPELRYATAEEFAADLDAFVEGQPIQARPRSFAYQLRSLVRRHKELSAALVLLVLGAFALSLFFVERLRSEVEDKTAEIDALRAQGTLKGLRLVADQDLWPARFEQLGAMQRWTLEAETFVRRVEELRSRGKELGAEFEAQLRAFVERASDLPSDLRGALGTSLPEVRQHAELVSCWHEQTVTSAEAQRLWAEVGMAPQEHLLPLSKNPQGLWEFWHVPSGERPKPVEPRPERDDANRWVIEGETGLVFVLIPAGTFWMGAQCAEPSQPNFDADADSDEQPVHEVTLDPYFLSKYELTHGQWSRLTNRRVAAVPASPMEWVTWSDCQRVLARIIDAQLPTEAQWERGCRGGTSTPWWTGADEAALGDAAVLTESEKEGIGTRRANPFGLHDVHGGVWEWCRDDYEDYDAHSRAGDGLRGMDDPSGEGGPRRVYRGGGWHGDASDCRSASRDAYEPGIAGAGLGFRPVLAARSTAERR